MDYRYIGFTLGHALSRKLHCYRGNCDLNEIFIILFSAFKIKVFLFIFYFELHTRQPNSKYNNRYLGNKYDCILAGKSKPGFPW